MSNPSKTRRKFLVTGGSGFIGSALVKALLKSGASVRVFDNHCRGSKVNLQGLENSIELVEGDLRDLNSVRNAVQGVDSVCHLGAINGTQNFYTKPELVLEVAVNGMLNVLDACMEHGVGDLIFTSSSEVYQAPSKIPTDETVALSIPDPLNPRFSYGGGKLISELLTINYGRKYFKRVSIVRPHNVYGPAMGWDHVIPQLVEKATKSYRSDAATLEIPIQGSGDETRAFIYISDFIDGMMTVIDKGAHLGIYHLGNETEVSIRSLASEIGSCFRKKVVVTSTELTQGSVSRRCPDTSKVKALGFAPKVSLTEGLRQTVEWYRSNPLQERKELGEWRTPELRP